MSFKLISGKKGILPENFFEALIAVGGILLLGFLAFKLSYFFVNMDERNANNFLDSLKGKIELVPNGEENTFVLDGVKERYLLAWDKSALEENKPEKCFDKNCLCLCKEASIENCQEEGLCRYINRAVSVSSKLSTHSSLKDARIGTITVGKDYFAVCIPTFDKLMAFSTSVKDEKIYLLVDYGIMSSGEDIKKVYYGLEESECHTNNIDNNLL